MATARNLLRVYRGPGVVSLLLLAVLGLWTCQRVTELQRHGLERLREAASAGSAALEGILRSLRTQGPLRRRQVALVLESVRGASRPVDFIAIEQGGRRFVEVGTVPPAVSRPSAQGDCIEGVAFISWRPLNLGDAELPPTLPQASDDELAIGPDAEPACLILGLDTSHHRRIIAKVTRDALLTAAIGVVCIAAIGLAWAQSIRYRILSAELAMQRAHTAHLEELGLAAAGLAHETKNPLGIILGHAQRISTTPDDAQATRAGAEHIIDAVDRATARLGDFMAYARVRTPDLAPVDGARLVAEVADVLRPDFQSAGVALHADAQPLAILADEEMLRQVLVNLLLNSLHACDGGAAARIRLERQGGEAVLTVEDDGRGIAPELLPDIFKPYVCGEPEGHGLGLAIVRRFVDQHGWALDLDSQPGQGTRLAISGIALAHPAETGV